MQNPGVVRTKSKLSSEPAGSLHKEFMEEVTACTSPRQMKTGHLIHIKTWMGLATGKCQVLGEGESFSHGYHHWEDGQALVEDHISEDIWSTQICLHWLKEKQ